MKMGFALPLALLLALPGLARAGGWVAELGAMAGKPQAPSQYTVDGSAAGGSIFAGYEDFKGIGLGLGFDYLGLSGDDGSKQLAVVNLGVQYDFMPAQNGTPFARFTGGVNLARDSQTGWPGRYAASAALGWSVPIASHTALEFSFGDEMASPMGGSGLQMPFLKLSVCFGPFNPKPMPNEAEADSIHP